MTRNAELSRLLKRLKLSAMLDTLPELSLFRDIRPVTFTVIRPL